MEKVLSQEEIEALVQAARGGRLDAYLKPLPPTAKLWDVRESGQIGREQMQSISVLHEGFARNLTHSLGAYLRIVFQAALVSAEHLSYRDFLQRVPEITYLASCKLDPMGVTAVLQLDLSVAFPIIDLLLGGEGRGGALSREITEIEEQILESVMRIICRELGATWHSLSLEFCFDQRQQPGQVQRLIPPDEKTLSLSFELTMPESRGTLNLAVPAVASNALLRKISAEAAYQSPRAAAGSREQLQKRLLDSPFELELSLGDIRVPLHDIAGLSPGDLLVLPRCLDSPAALLVAGIRMFSARAVRYGAMRAAQLVSREDSGSSERKEQPR